LRDALRALRECLLPQYLDLAPEDFAALCRWDQGVADFAERLGSAVEQFSVRCLSAMRQKFLEGCATRACGNEASPDDVAAETGKCVRLLAEETASLRSWLERELPPEGNSVGCRLLKLTESSLVAGLFFLFLQQRFAELFRGGDDDGDGPRRGAEAKALAARRTAIVHAIEAALGQQRSALPAVAEKRDLEKEDAEKEDAATLVPDVAKCCAAALAALLPLFALAARAEKRQAQETSPAVWKVRQRILSAEGFRAAAEGPLDRVELVEYEPGAFPPLRCRCFSGEFSGQEAYREVQVCRFSRRGAAALSPDVAIPVAVLFGEQSRLAWAAGFLDAEANRHLAECRELAGTNGFRQCLPYLESQGAQWARIQIRAGDPGGHVTLLALPAAAMAMSDDFAENASLPQVLQQASEASSAKETLLRAIEAHWREKGIVASDYSICVVPRRAPAEKQDEEKTEEQRQRRRRVRRFLNHKARWPLEEAEEILKALGIVIEPKGDGAPHGKVRFNDRHHTLSSKLLKDGQVYATYLYEWIRTLGQERLLADLLEQNDPRLAPYMRKTDAGEE
jgi:hypothetical protein